MTDREIDALVAEKMMGWSWWVNQERRMRLIVGPEPWVRWNWNHKIMVPWNGDADIIPFSDWDRACHLEGWEENIGLPRYSTDPAASKQLRDKMRADGWTITSGEAHYPASGKDGFWCRIFKRDPWHEASHDNDESAESVFAIATLKAHGVEV